MRPTVLYDGQCRFCVASVRRLRRLDWTGRLAFADARDPAALAAHAGVDATAALARLHLDIPPTARDERRLLEGFHALRWIAGRLPALWILWPLLWLPGMTVIGPRIYDGVARNRFLFGETGAACPVRPPTSSPGSSRDFASDDGESSRSP